MTADELKSLCDRVMELPDLAPVKNAAGEVVETFCNVGARTIAQGADCHEFDDPRLDAEAMGQIMVDNVSGCWEKVGGADATAHAKEGGLAFAFMSRERLKEGHAHIDAVYPDEMEWSGSLGRNVPMLANVGMADQEERESQAFPVEVGEADYYIWRA